MTPASLHICLYWMDLSEVDGWGSFSFFFPSFPYVFLFSFFSQFSSKMS